MRCLWILLICCCGWMQSALGADDTPESPLEVKLATDPTDPKILIVTLTNKGLLTLALDTERLNHPNIEMDFTKFNPDHSSSSKSNGSVSEHYSEGELSHAQSRLQDNKWTRLDPEKAVTIRLDLQPKFARNFKDL